MGEITVSIFIPEAMQFLFSFPSLQQQITTLSRQPKHKALLGEGIVINNVVCHMKHNECVNL
jgi:hypothetical protein